jgi:nicotinamidase-related amidase
MDRARTALLIMDVQPEIVERFGDHGLTDRLVRAAASARTKRRVSAFAGSDLDMVLRAGAIDALVLSGIATSGCVLSTLRQAADLDFSLIVLSDGCIDSDHEVHRVLCEKVFRDQAEVLTTDEWIRRLN